MLLPTSNCLTTRLDRLLDTVGDAKSDCYCSAVKHLVLHISLNIPGNGTLVNSKHWFMISYTSGLHMMTLTSSVWLGSTDFLYLGFFLFFTTFCLTNMRLFLGWGGPGPDVGFFFPCLNWEQSACTLLNLGSALLSLQWKCSHIAQTGEKFFFTAARPLDCMSTFTWTIYSDKINVT